MFTVGKTMQRVQVGLFWFCTRFDSLINTKFTVYKHKHLTIVFVCVILEITTLCRGENMPRNYNLMGKRYEEIHDKRQNAVYHKSHEFIQKARYDLSATEWNIVHYALSMIKKSDSASTEYVLNLSELYDLCGYSDESYTRMRVLLQTLSNKSWWFPKFKDDKKCGETLVRWFNTLDIDKHPQKITFKFHENMMKYIFALFEQYEEYGHHYASLMLKYSLPMKKKYSPRLYELLMSYKISNSEWWFNVDNLKYLLNCENYKTWQHFRERAIDPSVQEINQFTDIHVWYKITKKTAKRVDEITFYMTEKSTRERIDAEKAGLTRIEGNIHYWDMGKSNGQLNLFDEEEQ
jgi:plasmid replication initiation protein